MNAEGPGAAAARRSAKRDGSASRPTSSRNVRLTSAFETTARADDAPSVGERDADRAAFLDQDALDARLKPDRSAARFDRFDQDFGEALRAAGRIIAAVEIIAEQRDHLGASEPLAAVADVAGQRREQALRLRVGDVARDELVERPIHPSDGERMVAGEGEQRVGAARQAGNAAVVGAGRIHAVVDRLDLFEQRLQARCVGGELAAEFGRVCAPVARRLDDAVGEAVGMIEPAPVEPIGDAEPGEDRVDRAAGMDAGEIVRAGVEAIDAGAAVVARLAQERVAIAAGDDMRLVNRDLEAGVGEQRRCGQPADPGADDGDVDRSLRPLARSKRGAGQR